MRPTIALIAALWLVLACAIDSSAQSTPPKLQVPAEDDDEGKEPPADIRKGLPACLDRSHRVLDHCLKGCSNSVYSQECKRRCSERNARRENLCRKNHP